LSDMLASDSFGHEVSLVELCAASLSGRRRENIRKGQARVRRQ
jgi:hypothetical protein